MRRITVAGIELTVLHSPGHTPGAISLHAPDLGTVFTGDTLFAGGPGATGRSYSDPTIIRSIRDRLLVLPLETVVRTGHGKLTTIGTEGSASRTVDRPGLLRPAEPPTLPGQRGRYRRCARPVPGHDDSGREGQPCEPRPQRGEAFDVLEELGVDVEEGEHGGQPEWPETCRRPL
jgi:glyoxylase-like metal-dependent hydrolase (beta-lactamase superfamily II)